MTSATDVTFFLLAYQLCHRLDDISNRCNIFPTGLSIVPQAVDDVSNRCNIFPTGLSIVPQAVDDVNNMCNIFPTGLSIAPPLYHNNPSDCG